MREHNSDRPSADAIPWAQGFRQFTDPQLIEKLGQLERAGANVPPRTISRSAWMNDGAPSYSTTNPRWREYQRARQAANVDFGQRLLSGELSAWGREGDPWGQWRAIPADAWTALAAADWDKGIVCGPKPEAKRIYGVVVARAQRQEMAVVRQSSERDEVVRAGRRRRNAQDDALLKNKIRAVLATAKRRWPDKGTRPSDEQMAKELVRLKKAERYSVDTVRKILSGTYGTATRLGIDLDW